MPLEELLEKEKLRLENLQSEKQESHETKRALEDKIKNEKRQIEAVEVSQSKTLTEITQLRSQHQQSQRKLERLESDLTKWKEERQNMSDKNDLKSQKVAIEKEMRAKEMDHAEITTERENKVREVSIY